MTADAAAGSRRSPASRGRPEPALGRRPDLCADLVGVRLRRVHHRRLLADDRRLASLPVAALRPRARRARAGDLGPLPRRQRTSTELVHHSRPRRAISRNSLHRTTRRDRRRSTRSGRRATRTTTRSPRRSSGSTRPSSSATAAPGAASTTSSTPPSNGSTGSTTAASSKPTARSRRPSSKSIHYRQNVSGQRGRDSNQTACMKPGAVQSAGSGSSGSRTWQLCDVLGGIFSVMLWASCRALARLACLGQTRCRSGSRCLLGCSARSSAA